MYANNIENFIAEIINNLVSELAKDLSNELISASLIGSTAEGQFKSVQDVDLLLIVKGEAAYPELSKVGDVAERISNKYSSQDVQVIWNVRDTVWEIQKKANLTIGLHLDVLSLPRYYQRVVHLTNLGLTQVINCKVLFGPHPCEMVTFPRLSAQQLLTNITGITWLHSFLMTAFTVMDTTNTFIPFLSILNHCVHMAIRNYSTYSNVQTCVKKIPIFLHKKNILNDEIRMILEELNTTQENISNLSIANIESIINKVNSFFERLIKELSEG